MTRGEAASREHAENAVNENKPMRRYLIKHPKYGDMVANGRNRYEALLAVSKKWGVSWTQIARQCEYAELATGGIPGGRQ